MRNLRTNMPLQPGVKHPIIKGDFCSMVMFILLLVYEKFSLRRLPGSWVLPDKIGSIFRWWTCCMPQFN